jgi:hypothetical protein
MKAITLHQPYATLVMLGYDIKWHETRSWSTKHRGQLAIHAAAGQHAYAREAAKNPLIAEALAAHGLTYDTLPYGALLGTVELRAVHEMTPELIAEQTPTELATGDWTPGRYAWQLENRQAYGAPVPCRGYQQIWNVPREVEAEGIYN